LLELVLALEELHLSSPLFQSEDLVIPADIKQPLHLENLSSRLLSGANVIQPFTAKNDCYFDNESLPVGLWSWFRSEQILSAKQNNSKVSVQGNCNNWQFAVMHKVHINKTQYSQ